MKIDSVNKWLILAANVGVIAGIVFLGFELHQNNKLLEAQARYNHKETRIDHSKYVATNESLIDALIKSKNGELLTARDEVQLDRYRDMVFTSWEWDHIESVNSNLEIPVEGMKSILSSNKFLIEKWEVSKTFYANDFILFMDQLISDI